MPVPIIIRFVQFYVFCREFIQVIEIAKISIIIKSKDTKNLIIQANVDHEYLVEKCGNVCYIYLVSYKILIL